MKKKGRFKMNPVVIFIIIIAVVVIMTFIKNSVEAENYEVYRVFTEKFILNNDKVGYITYTFYLNRNDYSDRKITMRAENKAQIKNSSYYDNIFKPWLDTHISNAELESALDDAEKERL